MWKVFLVLFLIQQGSPFHPVPSVVNPQTFFLPFNQSIPKEVMKAKEESLVAVEINIPKWNWDHNMTQEPGHGVGVTVWPNYVLMPLHLLGDYPSVWEGNNDFPTTITIFDGVRYFGASLVDYNYKMDLAIIKIKSPDSEGNTFRCKPIKRAQTTMQLDSNLSEPTMLYNKFFVFSFFASDPSIFFALELGPFRAITNNFDDGYLLDIPLGMVQGNLQPGFSGSPLFTPDGVLFGMIIRGKGNVFSFTVLPETIENFLKAVAQRMGVDIDGHPLPMAAK